MAEGVGVSVAQVESLAAMTDEDRAAATAGETAAAPAG